MWIVVCYDVNTETLAGRRRLRRVAQICINFGQRVQQSVFECQVTDVQFEKLKRSLLKEIDKEQDNLMIYRLNEPRDQHVEMYGLASITKFAEDTLIV